MASGCFRVYPDNFIDLGAIASQSPSSEQANFPVININNAQRRSKVWRTKGYFNVTSSNNAIIFEETAATPLTASIIVGEYTSISDMVSAIQAALNLAGGSNYTVTNDSTTGFKFKIASDRVAGDNIFTLLMANASNNSEDLLGFDTVDLADAADHSSDWLRISSGEFLLWDFGLSSNPQGFAAIGKRNSPIGIGNDATVKIQANITNNFDSPLYEATLTYSERGYLIEDENGLADQPYRYWRMSIDDKTNPNGFIELGSVLLGDFFDPARGRVQFGKKDKYIDRSTTVFSEGGQEFSDIKQQSQQFDIVWRGLQKQDIEDLDILFQKFGTSTPFFVSMDVDAVYTTIAQRALRYVKFSSEPETVIESPNNFTVTMKFREQL